MRKRKKLKGEFPMFVRLAPLIPEEKHEEVLRTMNLLENRWRDDLCKAVIVLLTEGKRKQYKKSRVMRMLLARIVKTLPASLKGRGLKADENSNK